MGIKWNTTCKVLSPQMVFDKCQFLLGPDITLKKCFCDQFSFSLNILFQCIPSSVMGTRRRTSLCLLEASPWQLAHWHPPSWSHSSRTSLWIPTWKLFQCKGPSQFPWNQCQILSLPIVIASLQRGLPMIAASQYLPPVLISSRTELGLSLWFTLTNRMW